MLVKKCLAEILGTFWLTFGGCGSAVLAAMFIAKEGSTPINLGIALVGVSLAFGLTVLTMAYAIGHISGCHLNPAVSIGLLFGGRFKAQDLLPYIGSQVIGAIAGAGVLFFIFTNGEVNGVAQTVGATPGSFATNGYGDHSPGAVKYSVAACALGEFVLTFFFLLIILGSTDRRAPGGFAPIPIGLGLTLIHLIGIPLTNTSVNPARSTGPALFVGGVALQQLWLFWAAPIAGAVAAGLLYRFAFEAKHDGK